MVGERRTKSVPWCTSRPYCHRYRNPFSFCYLLQAVLLFHILTLFIRIYSARYSDTACKKKVCVYWYYLNINNNINHQHVSSEKDLKDIITLKFRGAVLTSNNISINVHMCYQR